MNPHNINRHKRIGASDVPIIFGISPFGNRYELWLEKTQRVEPQELTSESVHLGNRLEDALLDEAESELGEIERNVLVPCKHDYGFPLAAQCDGVVKETGVNVEVKTSGLAGPIYGQWGEDGTDEVPDYYLAQLLAQQLCLESDSSHLYALLGGVGMRRYQVGRPDWFKEALIEKCREFWDMVENDIEPERDSAVSLDTLKRLRRQAGKVIEFGPKETALAELWQEKNNEANKLKREAESLKAEVILNLGDAEAAELLGGGQVTYLETQRNNQAREASVSVFRTLRSKKL